MSDVIINNPDFFDQLSDDVILALYLYHGGNDYNHTIGKVYTRLIEDVCSGDIIDTLCEVYNSKFSDAISNYNSDFFYQSREYIKECYKANEML